ncbi:MAG: HupE/UreJ family protein [Methylobacillus sp.]|jgi:urease accessory protein|nr:HupE/UreJ family protein [Methylobacillus sp.]
MNKFKFAPLHWFALMAGLMLPLWAHAHPVVTDAASGFAFGFAHPFSGLDHLAAMVAVGLWAAQLGGRAIRLVPLTFIGVMVLGGMLGMAGISLPLAEQGIVLSVLLLGVMIAASVRLPLWLSCSLVGLFALCHGHAHGSEMPVGSVAATYALGFVLATAALHVSGILLGVGVQRMLRKQALPLVGIGIAMCGAYLATS